MYARFPEQFRAAYGGTPDQAPDEYRRRASRDRAHALAKLPVALLHGSADTVIPVEHARVLVKRLRARQARVHYVEVANGDHDAPLGQDVERPLDWLLSEASSEARRPQP
jgi:predicted peptidase